MSKVSTKLNKAALHLKKVDPILASIIKENLPSITQNHTVYEDLLSSIISQQLSVKAAASIEKKFLSVFKNTFPKPEVLLKTSPEKLRTAGVSRQKAEYMHSVATRFIEYNLHEKDFHKMSDKEVMEMLLPIKGVGTWTVEMLLIFTLGHPDVFSVKDLGLVNAVCKLYGYKKTKTLNKRILKLSAIWSPYRSTACRYLWRYKDSKL
jgi:DNA-3-methyladenine glycosylase II